MKLNISSETVSEQHPNHPQPKPSPVQSKTKSSYKDYKTSATNGNARADLRPSQILVCEESSFITIITINNVYV